jgi:hypothetical protein
MAVIMATQPEKDEGSEPLDLHNARTERGLALDVLGEMAELLCDTRSGILLGGSVLGALTVSIAIEAAVLPSRLHWDLASMICAGLLGVLISCWLRAAALLALAGKPVLYTLGDQRMRTGAPVDPRPRWLILPAVDGTDREWTWARAHLLLGAARFRNDRIHSALIWTLVTTACFLAWTVAVLLVS